MKFENNFILMIVVSIGIYAIFLFISDYQKISEKIINFKTEEIQQATTVGLIGQHDFFIEITLKGTDQNQILLPVNIWINRKEDESYVAA